VSNKMIEGVHGKGGGYRLTRKPEDYRVSDILRLTEGDLAPVACLHHNAKPCKRMAECSILPIWSKLNSLINDYLDSVRLSDLVRKCPL